MTPAKQAALAKLHAANGQPVTAHGYWWPSQIAAARDLGVCKTKVCHALRKGKFEALVQRRLSAAGGFSPRGCPSRDGSAADPRHTTNGECQ